MYRQPDTRTPTPPSVVEYTPRLIRVRVYFIGTIMALVGLLMILWQHATHVVCKGSSCSIDKYAFYVSEERHREIEIAKIHHVNVELQKHRKGKDTGIVTVFMTDGERINLGQDFINSDFDLDLARQAASGLELRRLRVGQHTAGDETFEIWLTQSIFTHALMTVFGAVFAGLAIAMFREQIRQLFAIRFVVDHDRGVLLVRGRKIPLREVQGVDIESGRALYWSSGKNEHIPGWRIVIKTARRGEIEDTFPATKDFRAGSHADHAEAVNKLARALRGDPLVG